MSPPDSCSVFSPCFVMTAGIKKKPFVPRFLQSKTQQELTIITKLPQTIVKTRTITAHVTITMRIYSITHASFAFDDGK